MNCPIFLFSAGWRSGSTLLQRMLTATEAVLIWGEAGGALDNFSDAMERYAQMLGHGNKMFRHGPGGHGDDQFQEFRQSGKDGVHKWVACLNPPMTVFEEAMRALFERVYELPARELGYANWGIKEVQSGLETARFLHRLYPEAKFVFLVRNPVDCLISIKRRNWLGHHGNAEPLAYYTRHWARLAGEFRQAEFGFRVRYEDLLNSRQVFDDLAAYLDLTLPADFAGKSRVDWQAENQQALGAVERMKIRWLANDEMRHYGYT
jgi:hypothetical protein